MERNTIAEVFCPKMGPVAAPSATPKKKNQLSSLRQNNLLLVLYRQAVEL